MHLGRHLSSSILAQTGVYWDDPQQQGAVAHSQMLLTQPDDGLQDTVAQPAFLKHIWPPLDIGHCLPVNHCHLLILSRSHASTSECYTASQKTGRCRMPRTRLAVHAMHRPEQLRDLQWQHNTGRQGYPLNPHSLPQWASAGPPHSMAPYMSHGTPVVPPGGVLHHPGLQPGAMAVQGMMPGFYPQAFFASHPGTPSLPRGQVAANREGRPEKPGALPVLCVCVGWSGGGA